jgi:hypothetical protein
VKYTFTRCPSRIVMVGGICMKRSRMVFADCETLAAVPLVNAWEPLVVMAPPPCVISPAPANHTQSDRSTEDFKVVVVHLVLQPFLSDLVEAVELVEIDGVTVRHNQAVKNDGHSPLLAEARRSNLLRFAQDNCSLGDDDVLVVMRIQRI